MTGSENEPGGLPWGPGTATGVGSLPGTDPLEATRTVTGELPELPHLPELPGRGPGADLLGRTAALLVDLPVEIVASGWRATARPGRDLRRAIDLLRFDLDAMQEVAEQVRPPLLKVQAAGPWTLTAGIELVRGHRVLTDPGALREFTASLAEGLAAHVTELARRTGARIVVQLDEPSLPAVLAGRLPTPSGWGRVDPVSEGDAADVLRTVIETVTAASGGPVVAHCCASRPPVALLRRAGCAAVGVDVPLLLGGGNPDQALLDELAEAWDAGTPLLLGLVPSTDPERTAALPGPARSPATGSGDPVPAGRPAPAGRSAAARRAEAGERPAAAHTGNGVPTAVSHRPVTLAALARPAHLLADRLGFARERLATLAIPTTTCGLAGADPDWARRAMTLSRDLGRAFADPPEAW